MLWLVFALGSAVLNGMTNVIHRFVLKEHDHISYAFLFQLLSGLFFLIFLPSFVFPQESTAWLLVGISILIWAFVSVISFKSMQLIEASSRAILVQVRIIFVLLLSYILINESMTAAKVIGTLLIFSGILLVIYERKGMLANFKDFGTQLTILSAFMLAVVAIVDKTAMSYWNPQTFGFLVYTIPGMFFGFMIPKRAGVFRKMVNKRLVFVLLCALFGMAFYLLELTAYGLTDVSNVYPITRLSVLVTVAGGIILLKEHKNILQKLCGVALVIVGALFNAGYIAF